MGRKKSGQQTHDRKVKQLVRELKKQGYGVQIKTPAFLPPSFAVFDKVRILEFIFR